MLVIHYITSGTHAQAHTKGTCAIVSDEDADWGGETEVVREVGAGRLKRGIPGETIRRYRSLTAEERIAYANPESEDLTVRVRTWEKPKSMKRRSAKNKARRKEKRCKNMLFP